MSFINAIPLAAWIALAVVPPAIFALHLLKLRRRQQIVPSTLLWSRVVEDSQADSLWQKLQRILPLLLQLLFVVALALALLRPGTVTETDESQRLILLIDHSASMGTRTENGSRLDEAKQQARQIIERMPEGSVAMIIAFSDRTRVVQSYTQDRQQLLARLDEIALTERPTRIIEALEAASGLANPPQVYEEGNPNALRLAQALQARLILLTDGGLTVPESFALGNLRPEYVPIGNARPANNVGIVAFAAAEHPERKGQIQTFAQLFNSGPAEATVDVRLLFENQTIDARKNIRIASGATVSLVLDVGTEIDETVINGALELRLDDQDDFEVDDRAFAIFDTRRRARILVVTPGNDPLRIAFDTQALSDYVETRWEDPAFLATEDYRSTAATGRFDAIVFDRCAPEESPQANTLYLDALPPEPDWTRGPRTEPVAIIDSDGTHPLVEWLELSEVLVAAGTEVIGPGGSQILVRGTVGGLLVVGQRRGFQDAVLGFPIVETVNGETLAATDWPRHPSFPMFVQNVIDVLGDARGLAQSKTIRPGEWMELGLPTSEEKIRIESPTGQASEATRGSDGRYVIADAETTGIYQALALSTNERIGRFAVHLCDRLESDVRVPAKLELGYEEVSATSTRNWGRSEYWKWAVIAGLLVVTWEWWLYLRRVA